MNKEVPDRPGPPAHPESPPDFSSRPLPLIDSTIYRTTWSRLSECRHRFSIFFGKTGRYSFDSPTRQFGVMYIGGDTCCAFIETFGDARDDENRVVVSWRELQNECLWELSFQRSLRLVDLTGQGLQAIGADGRLCSGGDYSLSQRWSAAIHDHPSKPDGILYRARHDQSKVSLALYDRVTTAEIVEHQIGRLSAAANLLHLGEILETYDFVILP